MGLSVTLALLQQTGVPSVKPCAVVDLGHLDPHLLLISQECDSQVHPGSVLGMTLRLQHCRMEAQAMHPVDGDFGS